MRHPAKMGMQLTVMLWLCCHVSVLAACAAGTSLQIDLLPRFGDSPLVCDELTWTNRSGQVLSVTRLDFLLSQFALQRDDATWLELPDRYACANVREGRTAFVLEDVPPGSYGALRFRVGLAPEINAADPARYPADHPLNPGQCGLHWSWLGGYVFLALEGHWRMPDDRSSGYSFHLASARVPMMVELPVALAVADQRGWHRALPLNATNGIPLAARDSDFAGTVPKVTVVVDVARILDGATPLVLTAADASTHSRTGDVLAETLSHNVARAFRVGSISAAADQESARTLAAQSAPAATPYRFTYSAHFPMPALPRDNPMTEAGVALGYRLFHDPRLSGNGEQACAGCHQSEAAFSDAGRRFSLGAQGQPGRRNAMPLFNLAWKSAFFWDGRAPSLRAQVREPIEDPVEMHNTLPEVVARLAASPDYSAQFGAAFGAPTVTAEHVTLALEQFLLSLTTFKSRFDRAMQGRDALTPEEKRGFELFATEFDPVRGFRGADCFHCHGGPLFTSGGFANNGLDAEPADPGRFVVTGREGDRGRFAVPSLRNVALSGPYMHDGRFATLEEVVEHYSTGVRRSPTLDPNLAKHPAAGMLLSSADKQALVAFLKTLTESGAESAHNTIVAVPPR